MAGPDRWFDWRRLAPREESVEVLADPRRRLRVLSLGFVALCGVVLVRAAQLEATSGEAYRASVSQARAIVEPIAAARGRILARDGSVLAADETMTTLAIEYRYLEQPLNESWLRAQARARLGNPAARDPRKLAAEIARLKVEIAAMHERLAALCGIAPDEWRARCARVQSRVATIARRVNVRRQRQYVERVAAADVRGDVSALATEEDPRSATWTGIARDSLAELFAPPAELPPPRIEVREEHQSHVIMRGVPLPVALEVQSHPARYAGAEIGRQRVRRYPQEELAAHVLGYVGAASADADVLLGQKVGRAGVEEAAEPWLRGLPGETRRELDSHGRTVATTVARAPREGRDVALTLDVSLQRTAERLLDEARRKLAAAPKGEGPRRPRRPGGSIVLLDVKTGAVLAAAAAPRFDPNVMLRGNALEIGPLLAAVDHPLFDRAAQMALPPGSVFKTVTAIALLESRRFDPLEPIECRGYLHEPGSERCMIFRRYGIGHGPVALTDALAQSCNVYFYHHAEELGLAALTRTAAGLGFGSPTGCDWCREATGAVPPAGEATEHADQMDATEARELSIGQGSLTATPLQVARLMAAVANGGTLVTPHVLSAVHAPPSSNTREERTISRNDVDPLPVAPQRAAPSLTPRTLALVRRGLEAVVSHSKGTGYDTVRTPVVSIAGKTGTAESGGGRADHAWFAGYAPADKPRVAVVVVLEHGGSGAEAAGPLARQIVEQWWAAVRDVPGP